MQLPRKSPKNYEKNDELAEKGVQRKIKIPLKSKIDFS